MTLFLDSRIMIIFFKFHKPKTNKQGSLWSHNIFQKICDHIKNMHKKKNIKLEITLYWLYAFLLHVVFPLDFPSVVHFLLNLFAISSQFAYACFFNTIVALLLNYETKPFLNLVFCSNIAWLLVYYNIEYNTWLVGP